MITTPDTGRDPMLAISNGIVRVFKDVAGRGPRRARASFTGPDALVVVLEQTLTPMERNLVQMGEHRRTHELRLQLQSALEAPARAIVEDVLRRRTIAFATGLDPFRDVATVFFTLGARIDSDGAAREQPPPSAAEPSAAGG